MKRIIIAVLVTLIACAITCYPLNESDYIFRGISISSYDRNLLRYDDTIFVNKTMIESCLKKICGDRTNLKDSTKSIFLEHNTYRMPENQPEGKEYSLTIHKDPCMVYLESIDYEIIRLANVFVKSEDEILVSIDFKYHVFKPIKKNDFVKFYEAFSKVKNVNSKDIIDVINLEKKDVSLSDSIVAFDYDFNITIRKEDSLRCKKKKIMQKYK